MHLMLLMVGEEHKRLILLGKLFYHKSKLATGQKPYFAWESDRQSSNLTQFSLQRVGEMVSSASCCASCALAVHPGEGAVQL